MKFQRFLMSFVLSALSLMVNAQQYKRIVSLAPSITKDIYYLHAQARLVGCTKYSVIARKENKTVVGSTVNVNVEKIVSLRPDLVLSTTITNPKYIELLRKFNIRVEVLKTPKSFNEICTQYTKIADLLGKKALAVQQVSAIKKELDKIKAKSSKDSVTNKVFFQIGANPLYAVTPNLFMNDYILFAHAVNVAGDLNNGLVSRETIVARNPGYIFIATMGIVGEQEKKIWEKFKDMNVVKNKKIFIIDSDLACIPTPQTFLKTMKIISTDLNH